MTSRSSVQGYFSCPITAAAALVSNKWKPVIIARLLNGPMRFSEIRRSIPQISSKVLSENLTELEAAEIIVRKVVEVKPPHTLYSLTRKGEALKSVLDEMEKWGRIWAKKPRNHS